MFKRVVILVILGFVFLIATGYFVLNQNKANTQPNDQAQTDNQPSPSLVKKTIYINDKVALIADVADTPETQAQGLSGRDSMDDGAGMLFVFQQPGLYAFWMKDMHFPLDFIWINENYQIIDITKNIPPESYPQTYQPSSPAKYVIEVSAGWTDKHSVNLGDDVSW